MKVVIHPFDEVGNPIDTSFQKGNFEPRETIQDATTHKRVETHQHGKRKAQDVSAVAVGEGTLEARMAPASVHADWKFEALGLRPDWIEILMAQKRLSDGSVDR